MLPSHTKTAIFIHLFIPVLDLSACEKVNLVKKVLAVQGQGNEDNETIMSIYEDLFEGLGCSPGKYTIQSNREVAPMIH